MHDNAGEILRIHFARPTAHCDVAKPLKSEMRLKGLGSLPLGRVPNGLLGRSQIFGVEVSGFVEHFCVPQGNRGAGGRAHAEADPAHHILSHVENRVARGRIQHFHRLDFFHGFDRRPRRSDQLRFRRFQHAHRFPVLVVKPWVVPGRRLEPRVVRFAVINVRHEHRTGRGFPLFVAAHNLLLAILICNDQQRQQRDPLAIVIAVVLWIPRQPSAEPAVTQHRGEAVRAVFQQVGDVVGLILIAEIV